MHVCCKHVYANRSASAHTYSDMYGDQRLMSSVFLKHFETRSLIKPETGCFIQIDAHSDSRILLSPP